MQLVRNAVTGAWVLQKGGYQETFDTDGRLVQINENGRITTLNYHAESEHLVSVVGPAGSALQLEYAGNRLTRIIRPDGQSIEYRYEDDKLVAVVFPDGSDREYHYEHVVFPHLLTGITDENEGRFSTYHYDSSGKAVGSEHAGGVEKVSITRNADGTMVFTDPLGHTSIYRYVAVQHARKFHTADSPCSTCTNTDRLREYDVYGRVTRRVDFNGTVTEYVRGSSGVELSRTEAVGTPEQRVITTQWHPTLNLPTRITEPGRVTDYTYADNGNRLTETVTDPATGENRITTWTYNANGQVLTVDGPRTDVMDVTTYTYDAQDNLAATINALGHMTRYTAYDVHGNPLQIIDANRIVTELEYDLRQRLVRRTVAAGTTDAATTRFDYDPVGQLMKTTLPDGSWIGYEYDAAHRMTAIHDSAGNRIDYTLDAMGNRIKETVNGPDGAAFSKTFREYNQLNRLVAESGPEGSRTDYAYDAEGNRTAITDANENTTNRYDALNRLFETVDALSGVTSYDYDARDNLTQVTDPRGVTTAYAYNGFNELIETDSPDAGITTYAYDKAGNRIRQTDARGITVHYAYDALNRLTFIDYPGTAQDITYTYDEGTSGAANAIGRLSGVTDETGRTEYTYGPRGNLLHKLSVVQSDAGEQYLTVNYAFDAVDNLTSISYPSGNLVQYQRDAHGRVSAITLAKADGTQLTLASQIAYAPFGPVAELTFGNGITETRTFDREGRLSRIASSVLDYGYAWDTTGNITAITDNLDATRNQAFGYDVLHRIISASGLYGNLAYAYDAVGNRTRLTENGIDTVYGYAVDSNQLLNVTRPDGTAVYTYDANGNTTHNGEHTFRYGARNRLNDADGVYRYAYNALGQRVMKPRFQTAAPRDASGDGVINENDLHALRDIIKGRMPPSDGADCNQDGTINNGDVSCIATRIGDSKRNGKANARNHGDHSAVGAHSRGRSTTTTNDATALAIDDLGQIAGQILFVYDEAGHLIGEYDELGNRIREYVWLGDRPIAMLENDGVYYIHVNNIDASQVVTDQNGQIVWQADYKPFGEADTTVTTLDIPLRFPGQYSDNEVNLHYNYFRSYNPATGRYSQSDPIGLIAGANTYAYVKSNPLNGTDPYGLKRVPIYEIRKGIYMIFYSAIFREACGTEPMGCADYHSTESLFWTGEIDDSCNFEKTVGRVITGPREWFPAHVQWESASHLEYIYESDGCSNCAPSNLRFEKTNDNFPHPGSKSIGG